VRRKRKQRIGWNSTKRRKSEVKPSRKMSGKGGTGGVGKVGRTRQDDKQRKLTDGNTREKRVSFEVSEEKTEIREVVSAMIELRHEIRGWKEGIERKIKSMEGLEDRLLVVEKFMVEQREEERKKKEEIEGWERESRSSTGSGYSRYSRGSKRSKASEGSRASDNISVREVERIVRKNLTSEKEKEERKDNITIRGWGKVEKIEKGKVEEFLKDRLGLEIKVKGCKVNGKVIVVNLNNSEDKKEIMKGKSKLKGGNIFIDNDLTWEERKTQERINKWVKEQRGKGKEVRSGLARVRIEGKWRRWEEIEEELGGKTKGQEIDEKDRENKENNEENVEENSMNRNRNKDRTNFA